MKGYNVAKSEYLIKPDTVALTALASDGSTISLTGSPLHYGGRDPNLTKAVRKTIKAFEKSCVNSSIENSCFVDANGRIIETNTGNKEEVGASTKARLTAVAMSHNHPRHGDQVGILGGTFSSEDIANFTKFSQSTYRASASEGTYSISKLKGFNGNALKSYYAVENQKHLNTYKATIQRLNTSFSSGSIKYETYVALAKKSFNEYLVANHDSLRAGQKSYGYYYTLERRSKKWLKRTKT